MELLLAKQMALKLIGEHNLNGWQFKFDQSRRRFGLCIYSERTIFLSYHLTKLNDEKIVFETILHEIAHALVGPGHGHGQIWKIKSREIGCNGERCYGDDVITPARPYVGTCPACKRKIERFRRKKIACGSCCRKNGGGFQEKYLFQWGAIK